MAELFHSGRTLWYGKPWITEKEKQNEELKKKIYEQRLMGHQEEEREKYVNSCLPYLRSASAHADKGKKFFDGRNFDNSIEEHTNAIASIEEAIRVYPQHEKRLIKVRESYYQGKKKAEEFKMKQEE